MDDNLLQIQKKFRAFYDKELRYKYEKIESVRKKYLKKFYIRSFLFLLILGIYVGGCYYDFIPKEFHLKKELYFVFLAAAIAFSCSLGYDYKMETKFAVMDKIMEFFEEFKNVSYFNRHDFYTYKKGLISDKQINESRLFGKFMHQSIDDAFNGEYHKTKITVSEQELYLYRGKAEERVFSGVIIALNFDKKYEGSTVCYGKDDSKEEFCVGGCGIFFKIIRSFKKIVVSLGKICFHFFFAHLFKKVYLPTYNRKKIHGKQVLLEDVVFSKNWDVYADNQIEARYVLTPALMERMLRVKKLFYGNRLDFSFWGNSLLIAVHTNKDMFETTFLFKSALDYYKVQEVICQLYSIFSIIDLLKMSNQSYLGTKKES